MVDVQTIGVLVTAASVSVAAIYYAFTLRINLKNQELSLKTQDLALKSQEQTLETRQTQFFMQIYMKYLEDDLFGKNYWILMKREWDAPADYFQKFGTIPEKETDGGDLNKMMTFYEGVAVLVNRKMIDVGLLYELMPTNVTTFWAKYESVILYLRANRGTPNLYVLVESLSKMITDYAGKRGDPVVTRYNPIGVGG
jgi:hypothetical protein